MIVLVLSRLLGYNKDIVVEAIRFNLQKDIARAVFLSRRNFDHVLAEEVLCIGVGHLEVEDVFARVLLGIVLFKVNHDLALLAGALLRLQWAGELFQNVIFEGATRTKLIVLIQSLIGRLRAVVDVKAVAIRQISLVQAVLVSGRPAVEAALDLDIRLSYDDRGQ